MIDPEAVRNVNLGVTERILVHKYELSAWNDKKSIKSALNDKKRNGVNLTVEEGTSGWETCPSKIRSNQLIINRNINSYLTFFVGK